MEEVIKMQQAHTFRNGISFIPIPDLTKDEFFKGVSDYGVIQRRGEERGSLNHLKIIDKLRRLLPEYIDDSVQPGESQVPNVFAATSYAIPLSKGRVEVVLEIVDRFANASYLVRNEGKSLQAYATKSGVVIKAVGYHHNSDLNRELGLRGLRLGRSFDGTHTWGLNWSERNEYSTAFENALNCLCQGVELTTEGVFTVDKSDYMPSISYYDNCPEVTAQIRNPSLEVIRGLDQPVSEFMAWLQENAVAINTMGELLRLAVHHHLSYRGQKGRVEEGKVASSLPEIVAGTRDFYFKLAEGAFRELHPPVNNRMDYLVH